jgi:hypothetical protein
MAEGERKEEFARYVKGVAMGKMQKRKARAEAAEKGQNGVDATCCT